MNTTYLVGKIKVVGNTACARYLKTSDPQNVPVDASTSLRYLGHHKSYVAEINTIILRGGILTDSGAVLPKRQTFPTPKKILSSEGRIRTAPNKHLLEVFGVKPTIEGVWRKVDGERRIVKGVLQQCPPFIFGSLSIVID